ncbi:putative inorganic phosphate cotransporter [Oppia nitens]|uniref:putative inorganic phosphate cotransporter n=1 Tax=Oppia nitens TaxID=1686743 RepID=UPI0023DBF24A|nr:putative inorganic phosphate cotransporter [Oppia nitens]
MCRYNLSISIVSMAKPATGSGGGHSSSSVIDNDLCYTSDVVKHSGQSSTNNSSTGSGEFDWDESTQSDILGAFFYGYIMLQVVGGRLSELFGAKWMCAGGIAVSILINACTPVIARSHIYWLLLASRVVLGLSQAFIFPSTYALLSRWVPDHERSTFLSFPTIGSNLGSIATTALSGYLCEHGYAGGWPSAFYTPAIIASVWLIVWIMFIKSDPKDHRWISSGELDDSHNNNTNKSTVPPVPWLAILTSIPVWAAIVVKFTYNWNFVFLLLKLPSYFSTVFNFSISKNGLISSSIYAVLTISLFMSGFAADYLVRKKIMDKTILRKCFQSVSSIGSSICLAAIPLVQCNDTIVIVLLIIGMFMFGFNSGGDIPIVADMTTKFAATVYSIGNTIAFICGFVTPLVVGHIVEAGGDGHHVRRQWGYVFYMSAAINTVGGLVFIAFGSAKQQHWDKLDGQSSSSHIAMLILLAIIVYI